MSCSEKTKAVAHVGRQISEYRQRIPGGLVAVAGANRVSRRGGRRGLVPCTGPASGTHSTVVQNETGAFPTKHLVGCHELDAKADAGIWNLDLAG
jgi:hypothetical protein